jgi:hypothetical protein
MKPKCAQAVRAAAGGRAISDAKMQAIDAAVGKHMRELARQDRQRWASLTRDQQMAEAVASAMKEIHAEAALKEYRAGLQVLRNAETAERIAQQEFIGGGKITRSQAYIRDLEHTDGAAHAERNKAIAQLKDFLDAAESKDGTGLFRGLAMRVFDLANPAMTADIVREVFRLADGHTGNAAAKAAARAWLDTIEGMRVKFNAAGGAIGKLGYGYLGQAHDAYKVMKVGAQNWAKFILDKNLLDRDQYVREDGSLMNDAEVGKMLEAAHTTIAEHGNNKTEPGQFSGSGSRANRGSDHRVLHFKDGEAWMAYMKEFGEGSLYDAMMGHIGKLSRDIAIVERMGPNAERTHQLQSDIARRADAPHGKAGELLTARSAGNTPDTYWDLVKGATGTPENRWLAHLGSDVRNVQTAAKITWGPFAALADVGTVLSALHYNRIPVFDYIKTYAGNMNKAQRAELRAHEVIADSYASQLNRWTGDNVTHGLTGKVTNAVMKLSLMNKWTDAGRDAFAAVMMSNHARKVGKAWGELDRWDRHLMERAGLNEGDWSIITQTKPGINPNGTQFLSGKAIRETQGVDAAMRDMAATKWMAYVQDESHFAVVNPDLATRAIVTGGGIPAGTPSGEAWRSVAQFKSFPIVMLTRHWRRAFETPQGLEGAPSGYRGTGSASNTVNQIRTLAALAVTTTLLGALQTQSRQVLTGKDPIDMEGPHAWKFWAKSWAAGGGAGFLADVIMAPADDPSRQWSGHLGIAGPVAGAAGGLIDIAKNKHHGAQSVRWLSDQLPGVDMWQVRAAYEHWFLFNAQEALNPGYLGRMQQRAQKDWGQAYWWNPRDAAPERAPDLARAIGR